MSYSFYKGDKQVKLFYREFNKENSHTSRLNQINVK